jgi:hypothetical protein
LSDLAYSSPELGLTASYEDLAPGIAGNQQTLAKMRALLKRAFLDPRVAYAVSHVLQAAHAAPGDRVSEARALFDFLVARCPYRRAPTNTDTSVDPLVLLARIEKDGFASGNCNQQANLMACLGHSVRLPIVWVLVGPDRDAFTHIYAALDTRPGATGTADDPLGMPTSLDDLVALDTGTPLPVWNRHAAAPVVWSTPSLESV